MSGARDVMLAGAPVTTRSLELAATTTVVLEAGQGPPMVLLHGAIECGGALWAPAIRRLAAHYRLVVPDFPGLGESTPLPRIDLDLFADWMGALFARLDIVRPTLVAHSMLGGLAARLAARHDAMLSRLVVYAAPAIGNYRMPVALRYRALRFALRPNRANFDRLQRFALSDKESTRSRDPAWFEAFSEYTVERARDRHVQATMRRLVSTQAKSVPAAELGRIAVPTVMVWGRQDRMVPLRVAEPTATRQQWPLVVVNGAGHVPHIEQPEAFVDRLRAMCSPGER